MAARPELDDLDTSAPGHAPASVGEDSQTSRATTAFSAALLSFAALPFLVEAWFTLRASSAELVSTMPDDAFYYLEIGQRAARGEGFTFDGVHATSGYHPLWQWIVTIVAWIVPGETAQVRAARLLSLALVAAAFAVVAWVVWRRAGRWPALGALVVATHLSALRFFTGGMETPVVLLSLACCFATLVRYREGPSPRRALLVGIVGAVLVLARLDMVAVLPILGVAVIAKPGRWRNLGGFALGLALLGVPYATYHRLAHGSFVTTSAAAKGQWVDRVVQRQLGGWFSGDHVAYLRATLGDYVRLLLDPGLPGHTVALASLAGVGLVAVAGLGAWHAITGIRRRGGRLTPVGASGVALVLIAAAKLAVDLVVVPLWVLGWYASVGQATAYVVLGAGAGAGMRWVVRATRPAVWAPVAVIAALPLLPLGLTQDLSANANFSVWQSELDRASDWLRKDPPEGTYGAFDAGLVGYKLEGVRPVENLDGLVNDTSFTSYLAGNPSRIDVARHERIDVLINLLTVEERESTWRCARTLWEGTQNVGALGADQPDRVYVLDVSGCR